MASGNRCSRLVMIMAVMTAFSISQTSQSRGRKLFGGYRISPKICKPTHPSRVKSNEPAICMFNYECSRQKGEVVGACMDGFLFGACCQLPPKQPGQGSEKVSEFDGLINVHEIDHVPDIPILLNPDGTPIGVSIEESPSSTPNYKFSTSSKIGQTSSYTKVPTYSVSTKLVPPPPGIITKHNFANYKKPQAPIQPDVTHLDQDFSTLLGYGSTLDDLQLPGLITHNNNDINEQHDPFSHSPVSTLLSPNQVLQIADPVDQLPALFSHGLSSAMNATVPETILLNENGTTLNETYNPDDLFKPDKNAIFPTIEGNNAEHYSTYSNIKPSTGLPRTPTKPSSKLTTKQPISAVNYAYTDKLVSTTQTTHSSGTEKVKFQTKQSTRPLTTKDKNIPAETKSSPYSEHTTPMTITTKDSNELVRVPTISYGTQSGNKKNDELEKEEIAINHIISLLNASSPSSPESKVTPQMGYTPTTIQMWLNEKSKPTSLVKIATTYPSSTTTESYKYTYYKPASSPSYYHYDTPSTVGSTNYYSKPPSSYYFSSRPTTLSQTVSLQKVQDYTTRPTTNPPAPTLIVLGPFSTDFTTVAPKTTPSKGSSYHPIKTANNNYGSTIRPSTVTKKPNVAATITHNISTVISGTPNNQVIASSFVSVNMKDGTTSRPLPIKSNAQTVTVGDRVTLLTNPTKRPTTMWTTFTTWSSTHDAQSSSPNPPCDDDPTMPDPMSNFPPVRHPGLEGSHLPQEKPGTISDINIDMEDIPTPVFTEDEDLSNKVDSFVNKIVESLQGNFHDLEDVVYTRKNITTTPPVSAVTKRPTTLKPTPRPVTTKRPVPRPQSSTNRPKPSSQKPKPSVTQGLVTRKPTTVSKRPKPTKKVTIAFNNTDAIVEEPTTPKLAQVTMTPFPEITHNADYRSICGIRPHVRSGKIVGGKPATFGEWPWQVLVREATWLGLFTKNKCGGVLITEKYVITAAHCQSGFLASLVAVFGEFDIQSELEPKRSITRNVRRAIPNRGYDPATFENDIALLELESPIQFDTHIVPICMPEDDETDFVGRMATVTGWGRLKYNGGIPSVLQEVQVPIIENSVCQEMFHTGSHSKLILDSFVCAGYSNGEKDSCEGDSGGPLTLQRPDGRWMLVGTVSHGIKCAAPYLPGVYMRTTYFKPWLHSITGV